MTKKALTQREFELSDLAAFLVDSKKNCWAAGMNRVSPARLGFKEHEHIDGPWRYIDSYVAHRGALASAGSEHVWHNSIPVWTMTYDGLLAPEIAADLDATKRVYDFLKQALLRVPLGAPFRGPPEFGDGELRYTCTHRGGIESVCGHEDISLRGTTIFGQAFRGTILL